VTGAAASDLSASAYNGHAPGSKLAFIDVNDGSVQENGEPVINIVDDIASSLFQSTYDLQSRIGVFAFGEFQDGYTTQDRLVDTFVFENPDYLPIFSAGNISPINGRLTVSSPGSSKNALSVGSSYNAFSSWTQARPEIYDRIAAEFHALACGPDSSLYTDRDFCATYGRVAPCGNFKATFCDRFTGTDASQCCREKYLIPICCMTTVQSDISRNSQMFASGSLSWFSARGPTSDGRIKPDLTAPGERIFSALSDQDTETFNCADYPEEPSATGVDQGTSYAAAAVAGTAAKVRQYFKDGYYPLGVPSADAQFPNPSAALVKAVLVNSAQSLDLLNTNGVQYFIPLVHGGPDFRQGHGRVQLDASLPLGNIPLNIFVLEDVITPNNFSLASTTHIAYSFNGLNVGQVTATLVWTEPPASPAAGMSTINNLDLSVVDNTGWAHRSNFGEEPDSVNNVEQVRFQPRGDRIYNVIVHATHMVSESQRYAIVVTGTGIALSDKHFACSFSCAFRGECQAGRCECNFPYRGVGCESVPCPVGTNEFDEGLECSGNGACDGEEGTCYCDRFWRGEVCNVENPSGVRNPVFIELESDDGLSIGATIGIAVGTGVLGLVIGLLIGGYCGIRYLIKRQRRRISELKAARNREQSQPLSDDV
jgi:Subtilase family